MYSAITIANFFIAKSIASGKELTPMKLVKLVYIAHGWYLGLSGTPLINEAVFAWDYGPVVDSVYHKFKKYGGGQIVSQELTLGAKEISEKSILDFLEKIWQVYGGYSGLQLSALTHQLNTPWDITFRTRGKNSVIPTDLITDHYKAKINANNTNTHTPASS